MSLTWKYKGHAWSLWFNTRENRFKLAKHVNVNMYQKHVIVNYNVVVCINCRKISNDYHNARHVYHEFMIRVRYDNLASVSMWLSEGQAGPTYATYGKMPEREILSAIKMMEKWKCVRLTQLKYLNKICWKPFYKYETLENRLSIVYLWGIHNTEQNGTSFVTYLCLPTYI